MDDILDELIASPKQLSAGIDRRLMERSDLYNNFNVSNKNRDKNCDRLKSGVDTGGVSVGEITGHMVNYGTIDKGMPVRSINETRVKAHTNTYNPNLDFELYRSKPILNVSYNDPLN